jgi:hypothetical protein
MVGLVMVRNVVEEVAMIGTMIGTMKSTMMWGYFMDELYNLFVVKPCWASMVLQGTRLVPGELKRWRRSMAAIGPLYFLDIKDQLLFLAVGICPLACGLSGQC